MTPLSPELERQIDNDAEDYADQFRYNTNKSPDFIDGARIGHAAGATAYAPYKEQFQQAKKALEEIRDYAESCKDMLNEASAGIIYKMATKALSTWKEEGKQVLCNCMGCSKDFYGPEPQMCCSGRDCGCMGMPTEPVVCSKECYEIVVNRYKPTEEGKGGDG